MGVNCGGSKAKSCALCPEGHGAVWCNGECDWVDNTCQPKSCQQEIGGSCVYAPCCEGSTCSSSNYCKVCQKVIGGSCAMAPCCEGSTCSSSKYCVKGGR